MREESHLDDMRDAIRGDFERLAERRGEQDLLRVTERDEAVAEDMVAEDMVAEEPEHEPDLEHEPAQGSEPAEEHPSPEPETEEPERKSWLARLFAP